MKKNFTFALIAMILSIGTASANTIVDTGPGAFQDGGWSVNNVQNLEGGFKLNTTTTLTAISGWMLWFNSFGGNGEKINTTLDIFINTHNNQTTLYKTTITPAETQWEWDGNIDHPAHLKAEWVTAGGLNWVLPAGSYWVGFAAPDASFSSGGAMPWDAPNPLAHYAAKYQDDPWHIDSELKFGVRIEGDPAEVSAVPLPTAMPLMLSGLGMLGFATRRKKTDTV